LRDIFAIAPYHGKMQTNAPTEDAQRIEDGRATAARYIRSGSQRERRTFQAECADARRLKHPNLLEVFDFGETGAVEPATDDGYWSYIVTEPTDDNLGSVLRERALDESEVREILNALIPALEFMHAEGRVHRRVRPSEIFACGDAIKLSPVGIMDGAPSLYDAPELSAPQSETPGPHSGADAWSVAVLTLECLTRSPYISEIDRLAPPFRQLVERGLDPDPKTRANLADMKALLEGRETRPPAPTVPPVPKYRRLAGLALGGALAAAAVCILLIRGAHQSPGPAPVTIQAPPPATAPKSTVQTAPSSGAIPAGWAIIGAAYTKRDDAEKRAAEIRKSHARLDPGVFSAGSNRFLVVFGSGLTEPQAKRQLQRVRKAGAPGGSYISRFR
jgi:serine/threonine protein kinase